MGERVEVICPVCGEPGEVDVETDEGDAEFVQDCGVCCRPWRVRVSFGRDGRAELRIDSD